MPRVTIGVPVYNAESLLEQCLDNLAAQTFKDFKVIVLDNASSDGTAAIAARFAARDPRFTYQRQPHNKGARQNFADVLAMADTPYFMWRADDDLSDVNFVEETVRLLDAAPAAALAVGRVVRDKRGRRGAKLFPRRWPLEAEASYRIRLLMRSRAGWIFGLFKTAELKSSFDHVVANYRHVTGFDHLIVYPFLLTMRVVGSNNTTFVAGYVERPTSQKAGFLDPRMMRTLRNDFRKHCETMLPNVVKSQAARALMTPVLWLYADRTYRWAKIMSARLRAIAGNKPQSVTTKYD